MERDLGAMTLPDPYVSNGAPSPITVALADSIGMRLLHMVNADPARTPTFTLFGNPDIFFTAGSNPTCGGNPCVAPGFAWNHGDIQEEIGNTWAGIVGPGIATRGVDAKTWTDHTNLRPTIMALTGLKDDYVTDGRVLYEAMSSHTALAATASGMQLAQLYEKINAPFGQFAQDTLAASRRRMTPDAFAVTLSFNNRPERLNIPFAAITRFADPAAGFELQFAAEEERQETGQGGSLPEQEGPTPPAAPSQLPLSPEERPQSPRKTADAETLKDRAAAQGEPKVISIDSFRKKS